jgi:hypothetical protein
LILKNPFMPNPNTASFFSCFFSLVILFLLSGCAPQVEISNVSNGVVYVVVDKNSEMGILSKGKLTQSIDGFAREITISGSGTYITNFSQKVQLVAGEPYTLKLEASVGRLRISNLSGASLSEYYLSTTSNSAWGTSLGTLANNSGVVYRMSAGSWDFKTKQGGSNVILTPIFVELDKDVLVKITSTSVSSLGL